MRNDSRRMSSGLIASPHHYLWCSVPDSHCSLALRVARLKSMVNIFERDLVTTHFCCFCFVSRLNRWKMSDHYECCQDMDREARASVIRIWILSSRRIRGHLKSIWQTKPPVTVTYFAEQYPILSYPEEIITMRINQQKQMWKPPLQSESPTRSWKRQQLSQVEWPCNCALSTSRRKHPSF